MGLEGHHLNLPKYDFRVNYFETLDLIMASLSTRPSFIAFSNLESSVKKSRNC